MLKPESRKLLLLAGLLCQGLLSGCATIINGPTQAIPVASDPAFADVVVDGQSMGQTPTDITLTRKRNHLVILSKEGYRQKSIAVTRAIGYAVWGNAIAGGLIGWGIDATSGSQNNLSPDIISVKLEPQSRVKQADITDENQQRNVVRSMQTTLRDNRYYDGPVDGFLTSQTFAAVMKYKRDQPGSRTPTVFDAETLTLFKIQ